MELPLLTTSLHEHGQIGGRTVIHGETIAGMADRVLKVREDGNTNWEAMEKKAIIQGMIRMC